MKKLLSLALSLAMAMLLLTGCGSSNTGTSPTPSGSPSAPSSPSASSAATTTDFSKIKIALVLSGSAKDGGWSQLAADAVNNVKEKYNCQVNYSESVATTDYESTIRGYADAGYNIIIAHGAEFLNASKLVATDYPKITFINTSALEGQDPNLSGIDFGSYQGGFLVGAAAALATDTNKIGMVDASETGSAATMLEGMKAGMKYVNADCQLFTVNTGSWDDAAKAKQAVDALVAKGVDTFSQDCDSAGAGAIAECDTLGKMNVGFVSDQSTLGDSVFMSVVQDAQLGIETSVEEALQGTLKTGFAIMGADVNVIRLADKYTGKYADKLTADEKATLQDLYEKAKSGVDLSTLTK